MSDTPSRSNKTPWYHSIAEDRSKNVTTSSKSSNGRVHANANAASFGSPSPTPPSTLRVSRLSLSQNKRRRKKRDKLAREKKNAQEEQVNDPNNEDVVILANGKSRKYYRSQNGIIMLKRSSTPTPPPTKREKPFFSYSLDNDSENEDENEDREDNYSAYDIASSMQETSTSKNVHKPSSNGVEHEHNNGDEITSPIQNTSLTEKKASHKTAKGVENSIVNEITLPIHTHSSTEQEQTSHKTTSNGVEINNGKEMMSSMHTDSSMEEIPYKLSPNDSDNTSPKQKASLTDKAPHKPMSNDVENNEIALPTQNTSLAEKALQKTASNGVERNNGNVITSPIQNTSLTGKAPHKPMSNDVENNEIALPTQNTSLAEKALQKTTYNGMEINNGKVITSPAQNTSVTGKAPLIKPMSNDVENNEIALPTQNTSLAEKALQKMTYNGMERNNGKVITSPAQNTSVTGKAPLIKPMSNDAENGNGNETTSLAQKPSSIVKDAPYKPASNGVENDIDDEIMSSMHNNSSIEKVSHNPSSSAENRNEDEKSKLMVSALPKKRQRVSDSLDGSSDEIANAQYLNSTVHDSSSLHLQENDTNAHKLSSNDVKNNNDNELMSSMHNAFLTEKIPREPSSIVREVNKVEKSKIEALASPKKRQRVFPSLDGSSDESDLAEDVSNSVHDISSSRAHDDHVDDLELLTQPISDDNHSNKQSCVEQSPQHVQTRNDARDNSPKIERLLRREEVRSSVNANNRNGSNRKRSRISVQEIEFATPIRSGTTRLPFPKMNLDMNKDILNQEVDDFDMNTNNEDDDEILSNVIINEEEEEEEKEKEEHDQIPKILDYNQKVAAQRRRNQKRLEVLGFTKGGIINMVTGGDKIVKGDGEEDNDSDDESEDETYPTGMLFGTRTNNLRNEPKPYQVCTKSKPGEDTQTRQETSLFELFPHRRKEIYILQSCLMNTVRQTEISIRARNTCRDFYIPPPIFVSGTSGTGKTSVVRGVIRKVRGDLKRSKSNINVGNQIGTKKKDYVRLGSAYINCATIEAYGSGAGAILESIYSQFAQDFCPEKKTPQRPGHNSISSNFSLGGSSVSMESDSAGDFSDSYGFSTDDDSIADSSVDAHSLSAGDTENNHLEGDLEDEDLMEKTAAAERGAIRKQANVTSTASMTSKASRSQGTAISSKKEPRRSTRSQAIGMPVREKASGPKMKPQPRKHALSLHGALSSPAVFGRSINQFCGVTGLYRGCAILILDQADKLLGFSNSKQKNSSPTNFLSELLLLPKVMKLNMTIIVITNKLFLESTRISNIEHPTNTLGTINAAIAPLKCHFEAYQNKQVIRDVLLCPHLMELATGIEKPIDDQILPPQIITQLYRSLTDIIVQSVETTTNDIREIMRLARILWPLYIKPLDKCANKFRARESIDGSPQVENSLLTRDVLETLGQALRPHIKMVLQQCLLQPTKSIAVSSTCSEQNSIEDLPHLFKFMLLAAYLCQTNKSDHDQLLYTNARSGRRRNRKGANSHSEGLTHGSSRAALKHMKSERISCFPLERMLSVFSSICNKYANGGTESAGAAASVSVDKEIYQDINVFQLGSISLMKCLSELRQHGLIHDAYSTKSTARDPSMAYSKSVTSTQLCCTLSKNRAKDVAEGLGFPLDDYLTENK